MQVKCNVYEHHARLVIRDLPANSIQGCGSDTLCKAKSKCCQDFGEASFINDKCAYHQASHNHAHVAAVSAS